jgi:HNH endonuclease
MLRNAEAKRQLGYTDPKSFVRFDDSEVLHRKDWKKRKLELWERSEKRCEGVRSDGSRCRVTFADISEMEPHHIVPRHPRRNDQLKNLAALCHWCHDKLNRRKVQWTKRTE